VSLLEVEQLTGGYGAVRVLHGIDFSVDEGEVVVILGANGAGKTTTLRAISGMVKASGSIRLDGVELLGQGSHHIARAGVGHVPQGRGTFADLNQNYDYDKDSEKKDEAYRIVRAEKKEGDKWAIVSLFEFNGQQVEFPIPAVVKFAGDTRVFQTMPHAPIAVSNIAKLLLIQER